MQADILSKIPARVVVKELVSSRYADGKRPENWDMRVEGMDMVRTVEGKLIKLISDGGQMPPQENWEILITRGDAEKGYNWTLYGLVR